MNGFDVRMCARAARKRSESAGVPGVDEVA